jgi:hypothetical protein
MNDWLWFHLAMGRDVRFYEWDARMNCPDFESLCAQGHFIRDLEAEKTDYLITKYGQTLDLYRISGVIFGIDTENRGEPPVVVDPRELIQYRINWDPWLRRVREVNGLGGASSWLHRQLAFLGEKTDGIRKIGVVLGFCGPGDAAMDLLLGLPVRMPSGYDIAVTTINFDQLPQQDIANLERLRVYVAPPINRETLEIDISSVTLRTWPLEPVSPCSIQHPGVSLTAKQKRDYDHYEYNCQLPIHLTGRINKVGNNEVLVANTVVEISDAPFLLFLRLLLELHRNKSGVVAKSDLRSEGYFSDGPDDQAINRLRNRFIRALGGLDENDFIEIYRRKTLRLSVHPDLVTWDAEKLLEHDDCRIKELIQQLAQTSERNSSQRPAQKRT